jgi:hypothetical protein
MFINQPPAERYRQRMIQQFKALEDLEGVTVKVSGRKRHTVTVMHDKEHAPDAKVTWIGGNHFTGTWCGKLSLWTLLDVNKFIRIYSEVIELRASRQTHGRFDDPTSNAMI